jgi:AcrR family transcriptional regulator
LQIADENGLEDVTLRGIAKRLNVHVTSLYNHIPTKEAVYAEMMKALVAEAELPVGTLTWREWVQRMASAFRNLAQRHPGAFQLFQHGSAQGEQAVASIESAIAAFQADGFDAASTNCAIKATNVFVLGLVMNDLIRNRNPEAQTDMSQASSQNIPQIREILAAADKAESFRFLLEVLCDGIAANRIYVKGNH